MFLDPDQKSPRAQDFEDRLEARIIGQERAVRRMVGLYQIFLAGMNSINRPIGTMLFLGPTGSGKTRVIEAAAEVLFADLNAGVEINCAKFQHSHEIAKLCPRFSAVSQREGDGLTKMSPLSCRELSDKSSEGRCETYFLNRCEYFE